MPFDTLSHWGLILLQLIVATVCGGAIGYQREIHDHPAGFRTHVLVCVGSAVYMLVSVAVAGHQYDPGRIAAQVASGIGFLGAGTIIKQGSIVRGLTTAASLWAAAGIGLAAGYNLSTMGIAFLGTLVVLLALGGLKTIENAIERRQTCSITVTVTDPRQRTEWVRRLLDGYGIMVRSVAFTGETGQTGEIYIEGSAAHRDDVEHAVAEISQQEFVQAVRWDYH